MRAHAFRAVAPGRINLIGEHMDYNDLPVLPMALTRAVEIDAQVEDKPVVRLRSARPARFPPFEFPLEQPMATAPPGDWSNYARAAAKGLARAGVPLRRGIAGTVGGDLPIAMGLSSSSALVVATALALLRANGRGGWTGAGLDRRPAPREKSLANRLDLAQLMAHAERDVGPEGGGMDQAASLLGARGHALRITFDPLAVKRIPMPSSWRWVVASSLIPAEKSGAARASYNARVGQCRQALDALGETSYPELLSRGDAARHVDLAGRVLSKAPHLHRRFRHVLTEGQRVGLAQDALGANDLDGFGSLMLESHASLRDDYRVSTPELDEIVRIAVAAGAAGARLTGAGLGGCAVALCHEAEVAAVIDTLARDFFLPRLGRPPQDDVLFVASPGPGARIVSLDGA